MRLSSLTIVPDPDSGVYEIRALTRADSGHESPPVYRRDVDRVEVNGTHLDLTGVQGGHVEFTDDGGDVLDIDFRTSSRMAVEGRVVVLLVNTAKRVVR